MEEGRRVMVGGGLTGAWKSQDGAEMGERRERLIASKGEEMVTETMSRYAVQRAVADDWKWTAM